MRITCPGNKTIPARSCQPHFVLTSQRPAVPARYQWSFTPGNSLGIRDALRTAIIASIFAGGLALAPGAQAKDLYEVVKAVNPYVSAGTTYDSNLLRLSKDESELLFGTRSKSDKYLTLEAGFNTDVEVSRQRFLLNGRVYRNNYDTFDSLDYTGGDAKALWEWTWGKLWDGELGYTYDRSLRSFANQTVPQKDIRTENKFLGGANRWLTDRWRLGMRGNSSDISFSDSKNLDQKRQLGGVAFDYVTQKGNSVGFDTEYAITNFDNASNNDYGQLRAGPTAVWAVTGKTILRGKVGYTNRNFDDNTTQEDYDGFTGRVTMIWKAHKDSGIKAAIYREISNLNDEISNYAVIHGIEAEPTWRILNKTVLRGVARFEDRDFKGKRKSSAPLPNLEQRKDKVYTAGLWVDWNPYRSVDFSLGYDYEKRTSTRDFEEYNAQVVRARVSIGL